MATINYGVSPSTSELTGLTIWEKKSFIDSFFSSTYFHAGNTYITNSPANDLGVGISHDALDLLFNNGLDTIATQLVVGQDDQRSIIIGNTQYVLLTKDELLGSGLVRTNEWWTADSSLAGAGYHDFITAPGISNLQGSTGDSGSTMLWPDGLYALIQKIELPTYSLTSPVATLEEGDSITFTLNTTNVTAGTPVQYSISGVSSDDIGGVLNSFVTVGVDGLAFITVDVLADRITEGDQILTVSIGSESASVTVMDQFIDPSQFEVNSTDSI